MNTTKQEIHYSPFLKLTILRSEGDGLCGETGSISGYHGMITCQECKQLVREEDTKHPREAIASPARAPGARVSN
jgi:hypothetical protein